MHWLGGKKILAGSSQLYIGPVLVSGDHKEFKVQKQTLKTKKMEASSVIFMGGCFRDLVACSERFPKVGETIIGKGF